MSVVGKYLDKTGRWPDVIAGCNSVYYVPFSPEMCMSDMAQYHIKNDLQGTLNSLGCGTDADWDRVAKIITQCITQSTQYDPVRRWAGDMSVQSWRNVTRQNCKAARGGK